MARNWLSGMRSATTITAETTNKSTIPQQKSFYRRQLPSHLTSFTSPEGRRVFKETLNDGYAEGYFNLAGNFTTQSEPAYCGPSSLAMVLNALEVDPGQTWKGAWRWYSDELLQACEPKEHMKTKGITFDQFGCLATAHCDTIAKRGGQVSYAEFLEDIKMTSQSNNTFMVLSFSRKVLGQTGDGHFSPIGGYHRASNQALVLDTARYKYPMWFGSVDLLFNAMQPVDKDTGKPRGYFLLNRKGEMTVTAQRNTAAQGPMDSRSYAEQTISLPECPPYVIPTTIHCNCKHSNRVCDSQARL
ncbi:hypothetical protein H4219_002305 [Mycoemilia scoparia]|uniref:glutathione gamma-glutamylcysteinyltransferase n=1 Tax=Mycoemilia scoparia TaxID=417184 RepID=A0A9W8DU94_9FUNG|nr:hypothetical protein H4219_002305 [Mycoemilia scoparia]